MEELFVKNKIALKLKEKGFDEPCIARYFKGRFVHNTLGNWYKHNSGEISKNYVSAPLYQQVIDWFRLAHGLVLDVYQEFYEEDQKYSGFWISDISKLGKYEQPHVVVIEEKFKDYYEAWDKAIEESLNVI